MLEVCAILIQCYLTDIKSGPRDTIVSSRDSIMARCNTESRSHPRGKYYDWDGSWSFYYQQCMYSNGQIP
jgi:hypothetical protein